MTEGRLAGRRTRIDGKVVGCANGGLPDGAGSVFSTTEQTHAQDDWFLTSADVVRPFFEDGAFDRDGRLVVPMDLALNKLGHAMHDVDPVFDRFSLSPRPSALVGLPGFVAPLLLHS